MTYSASQRQYWAQRPANKIKYMTVSFYHPDFGYIRLVANQFTEKTFDGNVYQPVAMSLPEVTNQNSDETQAGDVVFGRIGQQVKEKLEMITPVGAIKYPIEVTLSQYEAGVLIYTRLVYVASNGISIGSDNVSVKLSVDNIARLTNKKAFYDPIVWRGLRTL